MPQNIEKCTSIENLVIAKNMTFWFDSNDLCHFGKPLVIHLDILN